MTKKKYSNTQILVECAVLIAVGTVLAQIKLFELPNGGSVTVFSLVPFILISFRHGTKWGLLAGFANSLLQMALGGLWPTPAGTAFAMLLEILLDYVLAFTLLGTASWFKDRMGGNTAKGYAIGTFCACFLRFICSFLSGFIVWASLVDEGIGAVIYSLTYNGSYMLPETAITIAGILALYKAVPKLFS